MAKLRRIGNTLKFRLSMADDEATMSGALVGSNDDLLTQILGRLPVTSILRFKLVSKHWNSLLSHRRFTLLYHPTLSLSPGLFIRNFYIPYGFNHENRTPPPLRSLSFHPDRRGIKILQSCNGLLLCCSDRGKERDRKYYIFNPTTNHFATVPSVPGCMDFGTKICSMGLAFHRIDCPQYKIICILRIKRLFQIQIYSSDIGQWKICVKSFYSSQTSFDNGVYWNKAIYWSNIYSDAWYFKVDLQRLQKLSLPVQFRQPATYYFGECGGHLHLVERRDGYYRESCLHMNVYEMNYDDDFISMKKLLKYEVELDELPVAYPEMKFHPNHYEFKVLDVVMGVEEEEEEKETLFMVVGIPGKVIRFNLADKSFKEIFDLTNIFRLGTRPFSEARRYTQTLNPKNF
ncbi:hypothetical protein OSB04_029100 [Centaurea solstitialis]|uniref:F-box domain-containing protein n=1 Tax=Centaurea solstitialis TaxID=347529 RepID=A0AA38SGY0_9ASTR|nr:hypothetical protein OSB04_029100 [Centaurea solstitialis]